MFEGVRISADEILDLSGWNTSKVKDMNHMFYRTKIDNLNISGWDTSSVKNMWNMFAHSLVGASASSCIGLADLNVSSVTNMKAMFDTAGSAADTFALDLSRWDVSSVVTMENMFRFAGRQAAMWTIGDISCWDTSSVTNMTNMFSYSGENADYVLDLSQWNVDAVTENLFFNSCVENKIIAPPKFQE